MDATVATKCRLPVWTKLAFSVAYFRCSVRSVCIVVPRVAPVKKDVNAKACAHSGLQLNWRSRLLMERSIMCITFCKSAQIGHGFHETRFSRRPTTRFHRSGQLNRRQTSPNSTTVRSKAEGSGTDALVTPPVNQALPTKKNGRFGFLTSNA